MNITPSLLGCSHGGWDLALWVSSHCSAVKHPVLLLLCCNVRPAALPGVPTQVVVSCLPQIPCSLGYLEPHFPRAKHRQFQLTSISSSAKRGHNDSDLLYHILSDLLIRSCIRELTISNNDTKQRSKGFAPLDAIPLWLLCDSSHPKAPYGVWFLPPSYMPRGNTKEMPSSPHLLGIPTCPLLLLLRCRSRTSYWL